MRVGLNPYGILYTIGMIGTGDRANPAPIGFEGYLRLAEREGARALEIHWEHLVGQDLPAIRERLEAIDCEPVVSAGPSAQSVQTAIPLAKALGGRTVRTGLSSLLCGARHTLDFAALERQVRANLAELAPIAAEHGLCLAIEDHQDFDAEELMDFCGIAPNIGITLDCANPLSVAQDPLSFAETVLPRLRHVHLKDYRVQFVADGYLLVRCPTGDGYVPWEAILPKIQPSDITATLEIGALESRHIRCFVPEWWADYRPRSAASLAAALAAAGRNALPSDADPRTPWEDWHGSEALLAYERREFERSLENLRGWGLLPSPSSC